MVEPTNNACERALRPAVIQRKVTNGYRAMWAAKGEADIRTVVDTARLSRCQSLRDHPPDRHSLKPAGITPWVITPVLSPVVAAYVGHPNHKS